MKFSTYNSDIKKADISYRLSAFSLSSNIILRLAGMENPMTYSLLVLQKQIHQ